MGGHRTHASRSRLRAVAAGALITVLALSVSACGESSSDANEAAGTYRLKVLSAEFPTAQRLGETSLLRLGIRNTGRKTIPALTVTVSIAGKQGHGAFLPFAVRDPQPGLAQPDRPVWVLSARYPRFGDSSEPAGAVTSNPKTFDFGSLKPGATDDVVWKVSAVKSGHYNLLYSVGAGLNSETKAESTGGVKPGGSFAVKISSAPRNTEVTDSGEVVEK